MHMALKTLGWTTRPSSFLAAEVRCVLLKSSVSYWEMDQFKSNRSYYGLAAKFIVRLMGDGVSPWTSNVALYFETEYLCLSGWVSNWGLCSSREITGYHTANGQSKPNVLTLNVPCCHNVHIPALPTHIPLHPKAPSFFLSRAGNTTQPLPGSHTTASLLL